MLISTYAGVCWHTSAYAERVIDDESQACQSQFDRHTCMATTNRSPGPNEYLEASASAFFTSGPSGNPAPPPSKLTHTVTHGYRLSTPVSIQRAISTPVSALL
jgi:hypothetical protein